MIDQVTPRLGLPLLQPGQAQKEMTLNESLMLLDLAVQGTVAGAGMNSPPANPVVGACWIVGDDPTGAWTGHAFALAGWNDAGWFFLQPREGMQFWLGFEEGLATFVGGEWRLGELQGKVFVEGDQVVGARAAAVAEPSGGTTVDAEARAVIVSVLEALRTHGLISG